MESLLTEPRALRADLMASVRLEIDRLVANAAQLRAERDQLQAQVVELQERLEIATAPPIDPHPDRTRWSFFFTDEGLGTLQDAIEHVTGQPAKGDETDADALMRFCQRQLFRARHDHKVCDAANACPHAGLQYLAVELDWADALTRYGWVEAAQLVGELANARDSEDVERIVKEWRDG